MPLVPAKTTAISDAILGASCVWGLYSLQGTGNHLAKIWFALALVASIIGFLRFLRRVYFERLSPIHDLLSWLVLVVGLPCLTAQFYNNTDQMTIGNLHLMLLLPPVFSWLGKNRMFGDALSRSETNKITGYMALICMLSLTVHAIVSGNVSEFLACLLMIVSSRTFNMTDARKLGLPPVDWLHYGLAASNVLAAAALRHVELPGVDKLRMWTGNAMQSMFG